MLFFFFFLLRKHPEVEGKYVCLCIGYVMKKCNNPDTFLSVNFSHQPSKVNNYCPNEAHKRIIIIVKIIALIVHLELYKNFLISNARCSLCILTLTSH